MFTGKIIQSCMQPQPFLYCYAQKQKTVHQFSMLFVVVRNTGPKGISQNRQFVLNLFIHEKVLRSLNLHEKLAPTQTARMAAVQTLMTWRWLVANSWLNVELQVLSTGLYSTRVG